LRESQWQPVIRESESPGETSSSARERGWLPGRCGLLPFLLTEQKRLLATAAVADPNLAMRIAGFRGSANGFAKCGAPSGTLSG